MPVSSTHPEYQRYQHRWQSCRIAVEGSDAVKHAGEQFLPRLSGQDDPDYEAYKMRALFYGASDRTVKGLSGAVLRKTPTMKWPDALAALKEKIGGPGADLTLVTKKSLEEILTTGRVGLYVDAPTEPNSDPYICIYYAENIINWKYEDVDGEYTLTMVVLREEEWEAAEDDEFYLECHTYFRVCELVDGKYQVRVFEEVEVQDNGEAKLEYKGGEVVTPSKVGGGGFDFIPFLFVNPSSVTADIEKPPIGDLVDVNFSHYRTSADLEHGRHFVSLPTAYIVGAGDQKVTMQIGSAVAWMIPEPTAKVGYLEFSGEGLSSLRDGLNEKQQQMAVLGARLLEEQKKDAEAADTVKLRHAGEQSLLAGIAGSLSNALTQALRWIAFWKGRPDDSIYIKLNQDFNLAGISSDTLRSLMEGLQNGDVSFDTFFFNCERGELYPEGWTQDKERTAIEAGLPLGLPGNAADGTGAAGGAGGTTKGAGGAKNAPEQQSTNVN